MAIYKKSAAVVEAAELIANESYTENDFGRILYEVQLNDMAFFEAVLASDMNEIHSLNEGTLLEAEVEAANAKAKESLVERVIKVLRTWAEKISGAIKSAINSIEQAMMSHKSLLAKFKKAKADGSIAKWEGSVELTQRDIILLAANDNKTIVRDLLTANSAENALQNAFKAIAGDEFASVESVKDYTDKVMANTRKIVVNAENINTFAADIEDYPKYIKSIRELESTIRSFIKETERELKAKNDTDIEVLRKNISAVQTAFTTACRVQIIVIKDRLNGCIKVVNTALNDVSKNDKKGKFEK